MVMLLVVVSAVSAFAGFMGCAFVYERHIQKLEASLEDALHAARSVREVWP